MSRFATLWAPAAVVLGVLLVTATVRAEDRPIQLWHAYRGAEQQALEQVLAEWSGTPVETLTVPHDAYASKLAAAIPLGEGPDLFIDAHNQLGNYHARGLLAPVGDALEDPELFAADVASAIALDGQPYAVPLSLKCVALFVNPSLATEIPADLEAIAALAPSLPEGVVPLVYEAQSTYYHAAVLGAFGGALLGPDDTFGFVGPAAERSLDLVRGLIVDKAVPENADGALVQQLFKSGRAAFAISGPWLASDLADAGVDYRVALLPRVRATGELMRPLLTVEAVMFSSAGAARSDVRALARQLASAAAARVRQRVGRTVSARQDVPVPPDDELLRVFTEQARHATPTPTATALQAVWEPANQAIRKVLRGDVPPAEALAEAQRRFDDVRRPPPPPASPAPLAILVGALALLGAFLLVRRARTAEFRTRLRESLPAYRYIAHAVLAVGLLVFVPLLAGAAISLTAGRPDADYYVGLANFVEILTARGGPLFAHGSFYLVLGVTLLWTALNVVMHLGIGVVLGVVLSRPAMRLRPVYRVLLIIPWAVPNYVTALAWKGMFHKQFGAVTALMVGLNDTFGTDLEPISWFARFSTAFAANVATNVWLGFPFMMVVTLAALTSIPGEVLEAAKVDGASRLQRFFLVTLPIVGPSLVPAALLGAIWTFNMFNVVFLVSGGEPDGQTDILVSEAYRWAFTRQAQYGYAAAYAVLIFILLFGLTRLPGLVGRLRAQRRAAALAGPEPAPAEGRAA